MLRTQKLFRLLLLVYPREFRREYGTQMDQLFRDCHRAESDHRLGIPRLWVRTVVDLIQTAPKEHLESLGKDNSVMNNLRKDALAVAGSIGIIVVAFLLLSYGRKHEVSAILFFGHTLDALVTAGIVGNLIVFLLVKITRLNPLRTALWALLVVHGLLLLATGIIGSRVDPHFSVSSVVVAYIASFLFWFGLHLLWSKSVRQFAVGSE